REEQPARSGNPTRTTFMNRTESIRTSSRPPGLEIRRAKGATHGRNRNLGHTVWTVFGGGRGRRSRLLREAVDLSYQEEDRERNDQEVQDRIRKHAVIDGCRTRLLGFGQRGIVLTRKVDEQIRKVDAAQQQTNGRHQDVADEGGDDLSECCTDDDSDGHI